MKTNKCFFAGLIMSLLPLSSVNVNAKVVDIPLHIIVEAGGNLSMSNNGTIELSPNGQFSTENGALVNIQYGNIIPY